MDANMVVLTVQHIVNLLVAADYAAAESFTSGRRLNTRQLQDAISEYGRSLIAPPQNAFSKIDLVRIQASDVPKWSVRFYLWTQEEGESDLCLALTLTDDGSDLLNSEIDGIWVP